MSYKVLIPTAGIGSRLGKFTANLNKSLVSVENRPILSHIIGKFPKSCEFVIALGHKGSLVKDFLNLAYPTHKFRFVKVDPFKGKGSGLGLSILKCEKYLREPFVFSSCDTIVKENIPKPNFNWMAAANTKIISSYRSLKILDEKVINIFEKGEMESNFNLPYIGLAGIKDHSFFWKSMKTGRTTAIQQGEVYAFKKLLKNHEIKALKFSWSDTGNIKSLEQTRKNFQKPTDPNILEKENESIWFVNNKVIKFSKDEKFIKNRFLRSQKLKNFIPKVINFKTNMYSYQKADGFVLSSVINLKIFNIFLNHCESFWK